MNTMFLVLGIVLLLADVLAVIKTRNDFLDERSPRNNIKFMAAIGALPVLLVLTIVLPRLGGEKFTVSFDVNDGSGMILTARTVRAGSRVTLPNGNEFTRSGYTFDGWNTNTDGTGVNFSFDSSFTPNGSVTLYARWESISTTADSIAGTSNSSGNAATQISGEIVPGSNLSEKLGWLQTNTQTNRSYIVEVNTDENIAPQTLSYSGRMGVTITLIGIGANRTIGLSSNGSLFSVRQGVTLVLDNNITLQGRSNNSRSLVNPDGGTLIMNSGSTITGNTVTNSLYGGGVEVNENGAFTMNGGDIRDNIGNSGGVELYSGTFTMNDGTISGNYSENGGGVGVRGSSVFTMSGGTISGNTATHGGGVYVSTSGAFDISGGSISGNTADGSGGGVEVFGVFTMSGGAVTGNTASGGGGVAVHGGTFTMSNGTISGNTAANGQGGGVLVGTSTSNGVVSGYGMFNMSGGAISGNTARSSGGGVFVSSSCTFTKTGGTITGYTGNPAIGNVVRTSSGSLQNSRGHAVWVNSSPVKRKESSAEAAVNLSYNGSTGASSGGWDN
jgi:uncharacterized repeat protein (TIGR02543 family)